MGLHSGWGEFAAAFFTFFVTHSVPVRPAVKSRLVSVLSPAGFGVAYSLLSLAVLAWVIGAAGRAPVIELWPWARWQNDVTYLSMALCCVIASLAIGRPNPLSFGGARNDRYDPERAGIVAWFRHPLLIALLFWSLGHLAPNGNLAHLILFGSFAGFSVLGMHLIDRRKKRQLGLEKWRRFAGAPRRIVPTRAGAARLAAAGAVFALLLAGHGPVIGVWPAF